MANETVLFKRGDSATITSTPVTDGQILFDTSGNGKMYLDNGTDRLEMGGAITVDASLSKTSTNAIQNKAVTGNILNSLAEVSAATQQNTIAGALALKEVNNSLNALNDYTLIAEQQSGQAWVDKTVDISAYRELFLVGVYTNDDNMFGNLKIPKSLLPRQATVHYGSDALYATVKFNSNTSISMYAKNGITGKLYGLK